MNDFWRPASHLFIRALKQSTRPLAAILPSFFLPFFFFLVNSAAFQSVTTLPGFTAESYLAFYAPVALLMAVFFSAGDAGFELMLDITSGYFEKLMLTPISRYAILLPRIVAMGVRAMAQGLLVFALLMLFGAPYRGGVLGAFELLGLIALFAMGWSGIGLTLAALTKNPRVLQSSFILVFPLTFITTAQLPKELLTGWYKVAVGLNPVTYVLEGIRTIMTLGGGFSHEIVTAYGVALALLAVTSTIAVWSFKRSAN